jgi:hypothetical protein
MEHEKSQKQTPARHTWRRLALEQTLDAMDALRDLRTQRSTVRAEHLLVVAESSLNAALASVQAYREAWAVEREAKKKEGATEWTEE